MLDGLVGTIEVGGGNAGNTTTNKVFPVTQWRTNLSTRTYIDSDGSGVSTDDKPGLALVNTNIRYRDGSIAFFNNTDLNGYAGFNEVFPFMNWLVVDTTQTRFKPTWTHVVYDAGGPVDCTTDASILGGTAAPPCSQLRRTSRTRTFAFRCRRTCASPAPSTATAPTAPRPSTVPRLACCSRPRHSATASAGRACSARTPSSISASSRS